jgi:hypothetical protein
MFSTAFLRVLSRPILSGPFALVLGLAAGCTYTHGDPAEVVTPCDTSPQTVTYAGVISPIFDRHCRECHATAQANIKGGGNDFGNYQAIHRYPANALLGTVQHAPGYDAMPKGRAKIPECDILRIKAWIDAGEPNN